MQHMYSHGAMGFNLLWLIEHSRLKFADKKYHFEAYLGSLAIDHMITEARFLSLVMSSVII